MQDMTVVEPIPQAVRLIAFPELPCIIPDVIWQIDLLKRRVILETSQKVESNDERTRETARANPALD
jgi:hypothetical protein